MGAPLKLAGPHLNMRVLNLSLVAEKNRRGLTWEEVRTECGLGLGDYSPLFQRKSIEATTLIRLMLFMGVTDLVTFIIHEEVGM